MISSPSASRERARISSHLRSAERLLANGTTPRDRVRRWNRALARELLAAYRRDERFPHNHVKSAATPVFVDPHGTRCAVAHLMDLGAATSLVREVAGTVNLVRVRELAPNDLFRAWLDAAGLTLDEAAAIQPAYCWTEPSSCICAAQSYGGPALTVLETRIERIDAPGRAMARLVDQFGEPLSVADQMIRVSANDAAIGEHVLVPIEKPDIIVPSRSSDGGNATTRPSALDTKSGNRVFSGLRLRDDGSLAACAPGSTKTHLPNDTSTLLGTSHDTLVAALRAPSCEGHLVETDPKWKDGQRENCSGDIGIAPDGCNTSEATANALTPVAVLLALSAAAIHRQLR